MGGPVGALLRHRLAGAAPGTPTGIETFEIPGIGGDGAQGTDRSHSAGGGAPVGPSVQPHNVTISSSELLTSFDGLDHFQNRFGTDSGNPFSLEPPDQGLCVGTDAHGNTHVVEVLNDVMRVYDANGNALTAPQALNPFLGYCPLHQPGNLRPVRNGSELPL